MPKLGRRVYRTTLKNLSYALCLILFQLLGLAKTYVVVPAALAETPPRHPLTVDQIFAQNPVLERISACESTGDPNGTPRQFNSDGTPLWGNDPKTGKPIMRDVGIMQVNTWAHSAEIASSGLDVVNSEWDNAWYGFVLYKRSGTAPWAASKGCWGK